MEENYLKLEGNHHIYGENHLEIEGYNMKMVRIFKICGE